MGDIESLDRCGQQHRYHSRVDQEYRKKIKTEKTIQNRKTQKTSRDLPFDQRSLIHREAWFPPCFVRQNQQKKATFFTRRFQTTSLQKCSILRPLLSSTFPQESQISKNFGHPTSGSGGKIGLKIYHMKRDKQTHRQTHRHTDTQTIRLLDRIGPVGQFDENFELYIS